MISPGRALVVQFQAGAVATFKLVYAGGKPSSNSFGMLSVGDTYIIRNPIDGSGFRSILGSASDPSVVLEEIPDSPYPFFRPGGAGAVLFASGASITDDGAGGILFTSSTGSIIKIDSTSDLIGGAGQNWRLNANGVWAVLAQTNDAANGVENILGDSPTPAAVTAGATAVYSPVGDSLSHADATHPSPPTGNFAAQGAATLTLAEFNPTNQAGLGYYVVMFWIKVTANTLAGTIIVNVITDDDGDGGGAQTYQLDLTRASNGTNVANIAAGLTGVFMCLSPAIPMKADAAGLGSSSTKLLHVKLVAAGAGAFSARSATVITQVLHG